MIHNVSNKDLIKIQDQCYTVEQMLWKAEKEDKMLRKIDLEEAIDILNSMRYTIGIIKEEIQVVIDE